MPVLPSTDLSSKRIRWRARRSPLSYIITKARLERGLSQNEVAVAIGRHQSWINKLEMGFVRLRPEDAAPLAKVLGLDRRVLTTEKSR